MTIVARLPARSQQKCDVCGALGFEFYRYTSIALDETCPDSVPSACSEKCRDELMKKINSGEFVLPRLRAYPGGWRVTKVREGY